MTSTGRTSTGTDNGTSGRLALLAAPSTAALTPVPRVIVADDQALVRAGLRALLEEGSNVRVVAEASTGEEAVAPACRLRPDVVLVGAALPGLDCVRGIRLLAAGDAVVAPSLMPRLIAELGSAPDPELPSADLLDELTPREREVVALVAQGLSNADIAERLVISSATSRTHVSRAMLKLGARNRARLVTFAFHAGLAVPRAAA